ncbi:MAG: hypothetical protein ACXQTE_01310 [Methanosarcinaceae archaeon]
MNRDDGGEIMDDGKVMYYNWNRAALLDRKEQKTKMDYVEYTMRMNFQSKFACVRADQVDDVVSAIRTTLTPDVIKSVDDFMQGE